ncbi:hypothetical protein N7468_004597 [Penicillium chermesinum]|uniref:CBM-cenC domain-containing protein n=1 Tax=Penicillium chermesinum TaxID=63820 RepID=A0A9W9TTC8_9EURO|nr:uncharacterized protein N7468_004597 [Penicillium chermesinum]KAJ5239978.1 hypothetical protein N7468_004597 [Penicillium chermesinum]KAJ6166854.1 hypothetical protein N7470_002301 [Penicillium chermesinum]
MSSCNVLQNPSFESGSLAPWKATVANSVTVLNSSSGTPAADGYSFAQIKTAIDNGGRSFYQNIKDLKPSVEYTFDAQIQVPWDSPASYCAVYAYMGHNVTFTGPRKVAHADIQETQLGIWMSLNGTYTPKTSHGVLSIFGYCDLEDPSITSEVFVDAVSFAPTQC